MSIGHDFGKRPNHSARPRAAAAVAPSSGDLDEAAAEFYAAIQSNKDKADAYCNFGRVLQRMGRFTEALVYLRRGHEMGTKNPQWPHPSAQWVRECERFLVLDPKLPAILSEEQHSTTAAKPDQIQFDIPTSDPATRSRRVRSPSSLCPRCPRLPTP